MAKNTQDFPFKTKKPYSAMNSAEKAAYNLIANTKAGGLRTQEQKIAYERAQALIEKPTRSNAPMVGKPTKWDTPSRGKAGKK